MLADRENVCDAFERVKKTEHSKQVDWRGLTHVCTVYSV